jgi:hypothetical protein
MPSTTGALVVVRSNHPAGSSDKDRDIAGGSENRMSEYRFGLHSGEVSEYLFGLHMGHLTAEADQIAARHGAWHVNYTDPSGERRGWFACPNRGPSFYRVIAEAVMAEIDRAGGIKALCRDEHVVRADEIWASMPASAHPRPHFQA